MTSADRLDGGRHGARLLLVGLASGVLIAWAALATPAANPRASAATAVCGTLTADAEYSAEVGFIGVAHACEHLRDRKFTGASARTVVASHSHAVAAAGLAAAAPVDVGSWSTAINPGTKTIGISAVLLHTGKVLLFGGKYASTDKNTAAYLFDPVTRTGHEVPAPAAIFCGSVTQLSDGRVLSAGGADPVPKGIVDLWLFDPVTEQWVAAAGHSARSLLPDLDETRRRSSHHRRRPPARRHRRRTRLLSCTHLLPPARRWEPWRWSVRHMSPTSTRLSG